MRWMMVLAAAAVLAGPAAARQIAPVIVFFDAGADTLGASDRIRLEQVARQVREEGGDLQIILAGHADPAEATADEAVGLSQQRASKVRDHLIAVGVPEATMTTAAFGSSRPMIESADPKPENRRVEITFGPGSGW